MRSQRLAPLSGIVFVALIVIGFFPVGGSTPDVKDSPTKIVDFWAAHHNKEVAAALLVGFGAIFLAIFAATLRDRMRGEGGLWQNLILIGGGAGVAGILVAVGFHVALADGGNHHFSADAMVALNAIDNDDFFVFGIPLAIMLLGAAGATFTTGALPRWLGWTALVIAIISFTPAGFIGFGLSGIWIIIASILLSLRAGAPAAAAAA